eukprot:scaffold34634_cov171-Amphora_coffeaeformis.AAC.4
MTTTTLTRRRNSCSKRCRRISSSIPVHGDFRPLARGPRLVATENSGSVLWATRKQAILLGPLLHNVNRTTRCVGMVV